jgi:hypothetical protein
VQARASVPPIRLEVRHPSRADPRKNNPGFRGEPGARSPIRGAARPGEVPPGGALRASSPRRVEQSRACRQAGGSLDSRTALTRNGRLVTASAEENADLFWAVRGGGNNFGVVTSFLFKACPVSTVYGGPIFWPMDKGAELLRWWRDFILKAPEDINGWFESPPGKVLFRTNGWITHPRFSFRGDRIAFLHHPVFGDDSGEVVVSDLQGETRTLSRRWPTTSGLAWSPDDREVWFTGGNDRKNLVSAVSLEGKSRETYRSFSNTRLEDVNKDGQVLLSNEFERYELTYAGEGASSQTLLSWSESNPVAALSSDGKVLFSMPGATPTGEALGPAFAMLRTTDGAPAQTLGEGYALDLSADGRWALVRSTDLTRLTALPTGAAAQADRDPWSGNRLGALDAGRKGPARGRADSSRERLPPLPAGRRPFQAGSCQRRNAERTAESTDLSRRPLGSSIGRRLSAGGRFAGRWNHPPRTAALCAWAHLPRNDS